MAVASVAGMFMAAQYFIDTVPTAAVYRTLLSWMQIIFAFALLAGSLAVIRNHLVRLVRQPSDRIYSVILLLGIAATSVAGFAGGINRGSAFLWIFDHLQAPMQSTVFSLLAFYIASAAYRGFRARSGESAVLIIAAMVVLLGRVPLGEWISPRLSAGSEWIVNVPALAAKRAILIGIGLGMVATALKVIAGVERTYLGGR